MLIDTNVWSELSRRQPDARVRRWIVDRFGSCVLSAIVVGEIRYGIALADDEDRRSDLQSFHDDLLDRLGGVVAPFDDAAAAAWGPLRARLRRSGELIGERDMLIAAQALSLGMPLVTRNVDEMQRTGAIIIDPWRA